MLGDRAAAVAVLDHLSRLVLVGPELQATASGCQSDHPDAGMPNFPVRAVREPRRLKAGRGQGTVYQKRAMNGRDLTSPQSHDGDVPDCNVAIVPRNPAATIDLD